MRLWKYSALSVRGTDHEHEDIPCQDACCIKTVGSFLVGVVSDGAGSVKYSDIGARLVTEETIALIEKWKLPDETEVTWNQCVSALIENIRTRLEEQAETLSCRIKELSATFLLAIISPFSFLSAQIGDGGIIYGKEKEDYFYLAISPKRGEYFNETTFITSENYKEKLQIVYRYNEGIDRLALFTDGLQMLSLNMKNNPPSPHHSFFTPFFDSLQTVSDDIERKEQLRMFLQSKRVCSRTGDDKTLIFAGKVPMCRNLLCDKE